MKVVIIKDNPSKDIKQLKKKYSTEVLKVNIISTEKFKEKLKNNLIKDSDVYLFDYKNDDLYTDNKEFFPAEKKVVIIRNWEKAKQIIDKFFDISSNKEVKKSINPEIKNR